MQVADGSALLFVVLTGILLGDIFFDGFLQYHCHVAAFFYGRDMTNGVESL